MGTIRSGPVFLNRTYVTEVIYETHFLLILSSAVCLCSAAFAQQGRRHSTARRAMYPHRTFAVTQNSALTSPSTSIDGTAIKIVKTWDLGVFPGGTYVELSDVNDFGLAVGTGNLLNQETQIVETHTLGVALFGSHKGEWIDLGSLGGITTGYDEPLCMIANTGLVATHSVINDGHWHAAAWTKWTGMFDLGTLADHGYPEYNSSVAAGVIAREHCSLGGVPSSNPAWIVLQLSRSSGLPMSNGSTDIWLCTGRSISWTRRAS